VVTLPVTRPYPNPLRFATAIDCQGNPPSFLSSRPFKYIRRASGHTSALASLVLRILKDASGVLLLGGAGSALIAGVVAQSYRIPLISIAPLVGRLRTSGRFPRESCHRGGAKYHGLADMEADSAEKLIKALGDQRQRLLAEEVRIRQAQQLEQKALRNRLLLRGHSCYPR